MKLRHPALIRAAGFVGSWLVRCWAGSLRYRKRCADPASDPFAPGQRKRFLYSFWHETLLLPAFQYSQTPTHVLISQHADGELIAQACRHLGLGVVRGSTTRGGVEALRQLVALKDRHVVVTPDGPRGPRRQVQPGMIYVAARTGLPIVPVGFGYHCCYRLRSWDRFALPLPFSPAVGVLGEPIVVPASLGRGDLERFRQKAQDGMDRATLQAEEWAARETW